MLERSSRERCQGEGVREKKRERLGRWSGGKGPGNCREDGVR